MSSNHKHACCTMLQKTKQQQILDHLYRSSKNTSIITYSYHFCHIWSPTIFPMGIFHPQLDMTKRDSQPCRLLDQRPAPKPQGCLRHGEAPGAAPMAQGDTGPPRSGPRVGFNGVWVSPKNGWFLHCLKVSYTNHPMVVQLWKKHIWMDVFSFGKRWMIV